MTVEYAYETFSSESSEFDQKFTEYLNSKGRDHWKVKDCSFCHDTDQTKMWASCIFEKNL